MNAFILLALILGAYAQTNYINTCFLQVNFPRYRFATVNMSCYDKIHSAKFVKLKSYFYQMGPGQPTILQTSLIDSCDSTLLVMGSLNWSSGSFYPDQTFVIKRPFEKTVNFTVDCANSYPPLNLYFNLNLEFWS